MKALRLFVFLTFVTGVVYPFFVTGLAQAVFPHQANGQMIEKDGHVIGSMIIAQKFEQPKYFWPRPSAVDFNPLPSGGSNLGPTSADLKKAIEDRAAKGQPLYASASGLDPDISPVDARAQVARVANARGVSADRIEKLVDDSVEDRQLGFLGDPRVNVLKLNLALDQVRE